MTAAAVEQPRLQVVPNVDQPAPTRTPTYDLGAEQATLGAMLLSSEAIGEVEAIVNADAFYKPTHITIFQQIVAMATAEMPVDAFTVAAELDPSTLRQIGGGPYLHTLIATVPTAANAAHYAKAVAECAVNRNLLKASKMIEQIVEQGGSSAEKLVRAQQLLVDVEAGIPSTGGARQWKEIVPEVFAAVDAAEKLGDTPSGVPTGLVDLDKLLNGLSGLIVVAARTSVGKSTAVMGFAWHAAFECGLPTAVFSLEMGDVELGMSLLSAAARVPKQLMKSGKLSDSDWTRLAKVGGETEDAPLFVDTTPNMTLPEIRTRARYLKRKHDLKLLVVDYLQLIETATRGYENRQAAVSGLSRGLKLLQRELDIPIVAVSQLNRGPEQRADKRPQLSDLRESGSIEQDADVVILLHRDDYYDKESPRAGEADFIVAKHRDGPTDTITVAAQLHLSRFVSMAIVD